MSAPELLNRHAAAIEAALRTAIETRTDQLYRMMEYQLGWVDEQGAPLSTAPERPRAALCLGVSEAVGDPHSTGSGRAVGAAMASAAAVELLHEFTRVHEDIQSGAPEQENRPSGWWLWGPAQAINVGDALHMVARLTLLHAEGADPERVLDAAMVMDAAALDLFEGQQQDLSLQLQPAATPSAYLAMAERQSGAVLGCAAQLGALAAGADEAAQAACRSAGRSLGVALRLQDDIRELWGAEGTSTVVRRSFPVVLAIESAPVAVKREIGTLLMARTHGPKDAARLAELLDEAGARQGAVDAALAARAAFAEGLGRAGIAPERRGELVALAEHMTQGL
ncbi:MAG: polyprenyl synthetase family protein [Chloroflexota bacterium]|nr:polyprenyl synthetase family protein [Chloroflexota bacterium]